MLMFRGLRPRKPFLKCPTPQALSAEDSQSWAGRAAERLGVSDTKNQGCAITGELCRLEHLALCDVGLSDPPLSLKFPL